MRRCHLPAMLLLVAPLLTLGAAQAAQNRGPGGARVARGKYLVEHVAMCADCHTPRNERGEVEQAKWLWGAPLGFKNTVPMPRFALVAPPLAGLEGWTEQQAVTYLTTGKTRGSMPAAPPMPEYRMSKADAGAVVAYLKSLPAPGK